MASLSSPVRWCSVLCSVLRNVMMPYLARARDGACGEKRLRSRTVRPDVGGGAGAAVGLPRAAQDIAVGQGGGGDGRELERRAGLLSAAAQRGGGCLRSGRGDDGDHRGDAGGADVRRVRAAGGDDELPGELHGAPGGGAAE